MFSVFKLKNIGNSYLVANNCCLMHFPQIRFQLQGDSTRWATRDRHATVYNCANKIRIFVEAVYWYFSLSHLRHPVGGLNKNNKMSK